jgi:hypothetical protein
MREWKKIMGRFVPNPKRHSQHDPLKKGHSLANLGAAFFVVAVLCAALLLWRQFARERESRWDENIKIQMYCRCRWMSETNKGGSSGTCKISTRIIKISCSLMQSNPQMLPRTPQQQVLKRIRGELPFSNFKVTGFKLYYSESRIME